MEWFYNDAPITPETLVGSYGFVYIITNLLNNKRYIGKKFLFSKKTLKPLKGKTRKRHLLVDSGWRDYWSSSPTLLSEIETIGKHNFKREIISLHPNKQETNYHELRLQIMLDVLGDDNFVNENIASKFYRTTNIDIKTHREDLYDRYTQVVQALKGFRQKT
jgi:hypothetical protein